MDNDIKQKYSEAGFNEETIAAMQEAKKIADERASIFQKEDCVDL